MNGQYNVGDIVLHNVWVLTKKIGEGSYGRVFEAQRVNEGFDLAQTAAIKIITIPRSPEEVINAHNEGMSKVNVTAYFRSVVEKILDEVKLMSHLADKTANVVSYKDHAFIPHEDGMGWDIMIRMELLTPLWSYIDNRQLTRSDVIKLGIHICLALEQCHKAKIVHRDIKPENIFISEQDTFKLGDFGIARTIESATSGTKIGTYTYMAPEVYREADLNTSVDIYSLGLVLYMLLNYHRAPFLPDFPEVISHSAKELALKRRLNGEPLPPPKNSDARLSRIILKACAFKPQDRYQSSAHMRQDLETIMNDDVESLRNPVSPSYIITGSGELIKQEETISDYTIRISDMSRETGPKNVHEGANRPPERTGTVKPYPGAGRKEKTLIAIAASVAALLVIAAIVIIAPWQYMALFRQPPTPPIPTIQPGPTGLPDPTSPPVIPTDTPVSVVTLLTSVQGKTEKSARLLLEEQGMIVISVYESSETVEEGVVISQNPAADILVELKTTVTIIVSTGRANDIMPDVVGMVEYSAGLELSGSRLAVELSINVVYEQNNSVAAGNVISQSIPAGTTVYNGDPVTITVSTGRLIEPSPTTRPSPTPTTRPSPTPRPSQTQQPSPTPAQPSPTPATSITSISLSPGSTTITEVGVRIKITVTFTPADAEHGSVTWSSSNEAVARVDSRGNVTSVGSGTTTITARCDGKSATSSVTVR